jgi:hypothetical protein
LQAVHKLLATGRVLNNVQHELGTVSFNRFCNHQNSSSAVVSQVGLSPVTASWRFIYAMHAPTKRIFGPFSQVVICSEVAQFDDFDLVA